MEFLLISFIAGVLTVLSPCVLSLLPVIIGGSLTHEHKWRPVIITLSLAVSIVVFTLLLKVTSALVNIPPNLLNIISGTLVLALGLITIFPKTWEKISIKLNLGNSSQELLTKSTKKKNWFGAVLIGASLGPVFSSCSPTYAIILATVLPIDFFTGLIDLIAYSAGLSLIMLLIAIFGQRVIKKISWAANPNGLFRKFLGVLFIIVGMVILFGLDKQLAKIDFLDVTKLEQKLLKNNSSNEFLNVKSPYVAPEFKNIDSWINSNGESISNLKGKVVLVDFWTYSCINCIRTLPYLTSWYDKYKDQGLVIVGMHSPEFQFEKQKSNVENAVKEYGIKYPVAQDNNFDTWRAYKNQFWPATYFIDRDGKVRHEHFGEGEYDLSERVIQELLKEGKSDVKLPELGGTSVVPVRNDQTPETYLGYARAVNFAFKKDALHDLSMNYKLKNELLSNEWSIGGDWQVNEEDVISKSDNAKLNIKFSAKEVYLVMGSDKEVKVNAKLNGKILTPEMMGGADVDKDGNVKVKNYGLYKIVKLNEFTKDQVLELTIPKDVKMNAFTFGS